MKRLLGSVFVAVLSLGILLGQDTRSIRLRNGVINTPAPAAIHAAKAVAPDLSAPPVTGLFLLQFTNHLQAAWRDELRERGVELLSFVPDDAFVARLDGVRLHALRGSRYIRWIGPYEPRHKLHPSLTAALAGDLGKEIPVKLLLRPGATPVEILSVTRALRSAVTPRTLGVGTFVDGIAGARQIAWLARSDAVVWIERAPRMKLVDQVATQIIAGETTDPGALAHVHQLGFDGRGVTVAVADSGLDSGDATDLHPDLAGRVDALFAYDGLPDASDEHSHGTHVAGIVAGNGASGEKDDEGYLWGLGVAPGAHIVAQRIFDGAGDYHPPASHAKLTQDAVRSGAYVGSNSWGDDTAGQYDLSAAEFDALVRDADPDVPGEQPYVLEFSNGNAGPGGQTVGSPAVAKNVIATGATDNNRFGFGIYDSGQEVIADFSSRGPCEDGRIKPDIVAPGTWISSLRSVFANDNNAWGPISDLYMYQGGTSQAGPHASGACAIAIQWYRSTHNGATPSPALVKALLINSADDMGTDVIPDPESDTTDDTGMVVGDTGPVPNNDEGWGRINLVNLIDSARRHRFTDQGAGLATGQVAEQRVVVGPDEPLKVTLVYTDVPGFPAAIPALVNDLDLEVVGPDGRVFRGNAFADGETAAGTPVGDRINNVEAVHIGVPAAGEYVIRVRAQNVVQDVHHKTVGAPEQDFALVISGALPLPGEGVVSWDREAYRSPTMASVRLVDSQLTGQATATVKVSSTTETAGFTLTLARSGNGGTFTNSVALVTGAADASDGKLSAGDGDEITVVYVDAQPAGERRAVAKVDARPPLISDVSVESGFGRTLVRWATGEPADSRVYFGTTNAVTNLVSDVSFRAQHALALPQLVVGETYFCRIVSADPAGNSSTNDNGGRFFRFVGPKPANALLVYSPETLFAPGGLLGDTPYPGIETWTAPLDALGLDYEVWDTGVVGRAPGVADLRAYRLVLWRPEELSTPAPGLTTAITSYLQEGGALFVSSGDLLTRLKEKGATNFISGVLHVASFQEDQGANSIKAVPGDPVGGGIALDLDYGAFPSGFVIELLGLDWTTVADHLSVASDAAPVFLQERDRVVGSRFPKTGQDAKGRVVFNAFALEAVPGDGPAPNNRTTLIADAVRFLAPDLAGGSTIAFDAPAYTLPSSVVVEATDSARAGTGEVKAKLTSTSLPGSIDIALAETARRGVFRGQFVLTDVQGTGTLPRYLAKNGDTIRIAYVDAAKVESAVTARVDTVKPVIADVAVDPAYNEVVITWTTDKPADALVRFGESGGDDSFLTRSAYVAESATDHEVQVTGLLPDKPYFFQVVSRDVAGNITTDNAGGKFHTFRTLKPITPPWTDDLEKGRAGWVVLDDSGGTGAAFPGDDEGGDLVASGWDLGVPVNGRGAAAHSGTRVWATNLKGDAVDFAISDLISPSVSLVGGNKATLTFWQNYDFSSAAGGAGDEDDPFGDYVIEAAQVALTTDNGGTWKDLYTADAETSDGWEQVEVDLTRFVGKVVRFRFNYQLFSFSASDRLGWMLDDIHVDMDTVASTEVVVTNNLTQAAFTLTGPTNGVIEGVGTGFRTNVPPGIYVVAWRPVPFYTTPATRTNVLGDSTNALTFIGTYTFADVNKNGISDAWEQRFFGAVDAGYTGLVDSDGDGATDIEEWRAGTSPKDAASRLRVSLPETLPNGTVRFTWDAVTGRLYALETSNDLLAWVRVSDLTRATGGPLSVTLPALDPRLSYFFRVVVTP